MLALLNVNKPAGMTSRDVVNRVERMVRPHKVGHAGTLDPIATGVLVLCLGRATRLVPVIQVQRKQYDATFLLGLRSDTDDIEGDVSPVPAAPPLSAADFERVLPEFVGRIRQTPPRFSAVRIGGRRAYDLARSGEDVAPPSREVEIVRLALKGCGEGRFSLEISCGSGTYVRSIGRDIAQRLGSDAVMCGLVRTAIGPFRLDEAVELDRLNPESIGDFLLPAAMVFDDWPQRRVDDQEVRQLTFGRSIPAGEGAFPEATRVAMLSGAGELIALCESVGGRLVPRQVFATRSE